MNQLFLLHATPGAKRCFLLALGIPGLLLGVLAPWLWLNIMGVAILVVMVFFASAFLWESDHSSGPGR